MHGSWRTSRAVLVVGLVMLAFISASAWAADVGWTNYILSEDVMYWVYSPTGGGRTISDLSELKSDEMLLVKVQQTVYNQDYTALLKQWYPTANISGYLYAYSVSNLNVLTVNGSTYSGIKSFHVDWAVQPIRVTKSASTTVDWNPGSTVGGPTWDYTGSGMGLIPGETVGGLWAFAPTGVDGFTTASVSGFGDTIRGRTTGPVPEPGSLITLLTGVIGLAGYRIRTKK